jgi:hypothetical protein
MRNALALAQVSVLALGLAFPAAARAEEQTSRRLTLAGTAVLILGAVTTLVGGVVAIDGAVHPPSNIDLLCGRDQPDCGRQQNIELIGGLAVLSAGIVLDATGGALLFAGRTRARRLAFAPLVAHQGGGVLARLRF